MLLAGVSAAPIQSGGALDAYLRQLDRVGQVQVETASPGEPGLDADTRFDLHLEARWNYDLTIVRRGAEHELRLTPEWTRIEASVRHRLRLPSKPDSSDRHRALVLHEYDHVAISADERAVLLLRKLVQGIATIHKPWTGSIPPEEDAMHALVAAEVEARNKAVVQLIEFAYAKLDRSTNHGRRPLANRAVFAGWLFSKEHLKEAKFAYLQEAAAVLGSAEWRLARPWFRA